ncbi:hypothetical protein CC86DRAFT_446097 [Ophiobolus disseminans]|uniref:Uncharacterized protein n=1 Tax=Ophiobolus disseminans TaxID=1469910 RepID=A0A6A6ZZ79_9PLEO|nr:hypothetical protein CC86DRAFT_446097 [Ophiobolus disseminans]
MTATHDTCNMYSAFLSLPTEIRCAIYDYVLADSTSVTISAGYITVFGQRIQDRARKRDIPGLPLDLAPLARRHYDASLLSIAKPPEIAIDQIAMGDVETETGILGVPAPLALQLSCRLVNDELQDYIRGKRAIKAARARSASDANEAQDVEDDNEGLSLYVTYPYGVLVLKSMYPYLLKQARRVYISGYYTETSTTSPPSPSSGHEAEAEAASEHLTPANSFEVAPSFSSARTNRSFRRTKAITPTATHTSHSTRPRLRLDPSLPTHTSTTTFPPYSAPTQTLAPTALALLIRTLLPPTPTQLTRLTARLIYAGEDSYASVWQAGSPVTHMLRNMCGGKVEMRIKRGASGTGMLYCAKPNPEARVVTTSWENWRGGRGRRGRGMGLEGRDWDGFLVGEGEKML